MPAFSFEKISPKAQRGPTGPMPKKPRGVISQMIDRLVEMRVRRRLRDERSALRRGDKPTE